MTIQLAGCVLKDKQHRILLLHRNKRGVVQWELPGGKVEENETTEAAAIRELKEELGITVKLKIKLGTCLFTEKGRRYSYTWFQSSIASGTPSIKEPDTFDDLRYFDFEELTELQLSANMKQLVQQIETSTISWQ